MIHLSTCQLSRELEFISSLFIDQKIPKPLFELMVQRRIENFETSTKAYLYDKTIIPFIESTNRSIIFLQKILNRNTTDPKCDRTHDLIVFYKHTIDEMFDVYEYLGIPVYERYSVNTNIYSLDIFNTNKKDLHFMIQVYLEDIKLLHDYHSQYGNQSRVDMTIYDSLMDLQDEVNNIYQNYTNVIDAPVVKRALYQCIKRLTFMTIVFRRDYLRCCEVSQTVC